MNTVLSCINFNFIYYGFQIVHFVFTTTINLISSIIQFKNTVSVFINQICDFMADYVSS